MPYYSEDEIAKAREMDLLTYLRLCEPWELVKFSGNEYRTKTHDSLKISNGKWMWWSQGFGGKSALDYLIKVKGYSFKDAVKIILGQEVSTPSDFYFAKKKEEKKLLLPEKNENNDIVTTYLKDRGISDGVINYCIDKGTLYESKDRHHAIFIGFDEKGIARYGAFRATNGERFLGDASGSSKDWSFRIAGADAKEIHVFECAIDLMSYATLLNYQGKDFRQYNLLSFSGVYMPRKDLKSSKIPAALDKYLEANKETESIVIHFDNDRAGRLSAAALKEILGGKYKVRSDYPSFGKDYNDYLCQRLKRIRDKNERRNKDDREK